MSASAAWHRGNARYLAHSLEWLRLKLTGLAGQPSSPQPPDQRARRSGFWGVTEPRRETSAPTLSPAALAAQIAEAAERRTEAAKMDPPPALVMLAERFKLSDFERDAVLLAAAPELHTRIGWLCGRIAGNSARSHASFALALAVLDEPLWDALAPHGALRHWKLVETDAGDGPLMSAALRVGERVLHFLKGVHTFSPQLATSVRLLAPPAATLPPSQQAVADTVATRAQSSAPSAVTLLGTDGEAKQAIAGEVARKLGRPLYCMDVPSLPVAAGEAARLCAHWRLESALSGAALLVDAQSGWPQGEAAAALERMVGESSGWGGLILLALREPLAHSAFAALAIDVARPTLPEQVEAWRKALSAVPVATREPAVAALAAQYSLNAAAIQRIAQRTPTDPLATLADRLWDECANECRPRVGGLAMRIDPQVEWDDLIVNPETEGMLAEIVGQVRARAQVYADWGFAGRIGRGLGITTLFAGESGTGKTYAAEAIARRLRLPLYRIDLSQVVDKYIGETEKNLQRLFDTMEGGGSILFFDEADALFGKRSEVRDSHDRYANIEINYLLQRMENYSGLAILATNMKGALDTAFMRRLRFIVPFAFPGPAERKRLWERVIPKQAPQGDIDFERLSRLSLTGAGIRNVAMNAAFLAAQAGSAIDTELLLRAARSEFRKLDRPLNEAEFRL